MQRLSVNQQSPGFRGPRVLRRLQTSGEPNATDARRHWRPAEQLYGPRVSNSVFRRAPFAVSPHAYNPLRATGIGLLPHLVGYSNLVGVLTVVSLDEELVVNQVHTLGGVKGRGAEG